jgi:hypothetical protein
LNPVNFLFSRARPASGAATVDPATGLPTAPGEVDLTSVAIRISPELRNVRLIDVLDAIVKVADSPIRYSLEGYAVVFSAGSADMPSAAEMGGGMAGMGGMLPIRGIGICLMSRHRLP